MKISKKIILLFIIFILLVFLFFLLRQTYAKYKTAVTGNAAIAISRWNIKVNNQSIKNNNDISAKIQPVFFGNDNIASNIIAPTAEGYFDLVFNFKDVDVSFKYDINVSSDESSAVSDLVTTGYSVDGGEKITFNNFNSPISETFALANKPEERTIRIYIMWNDDPDTSSMNNIDDTLSTMKADSSAILKANIAFTQVASN